MKEVSSKDKTERGHKLLELSNMLEKEYYNKFIGKEIDVLVEEIKEGLSKGHTSNYIKVKIPKVLER